MGSWLGVTVPRKDPPEHYTPEQKQDYELAGVLADFYKEMRENQQVERRIYIQRIKDIVAKYKA